MPSTAFFCSSGSYSLSILDYVPEQGDVVKHYKIRSMDKGGYYISPYNTFPTLQELVTYYTGEAKMQRINQQEHQMPMCWVAGSFHGAKIYFICSLNMCSDVE